MKLEASVVLSRPLNDQEIDAVEGAGVKYHLFVNNRKEGLVTLPTIIHYFSVLGSPDNLSITKEGTALDGGDFIKKVRDICQTMDDPPTMKRLRIETKAVAHYQHHAEYFETHIKVVWLDEPDFTEEHNAYHSRSDTTHDQYVTIRTPGTKTLLEHKSDVERFLCDVMGDMLILGIEHEIVFTDTDVEMDGWGTPE